jgi:hypothetical protein
MAPQMTVRKALSMPFQLQAQSKLIFASDSDAALKAAFDPAWQSAVPYTVLLDADGKVLYSTLGSVDLLELHRRILAAVPAAYIGFHQYWTSK